MNTDLLLLPDATDKEGTGAALTSLVGDSCYYVSENMEITFGSAKLTVVEPISKNAGNESSLCILFQVDNCDILITDDRGVLGELMLLRQIELPEVELFIVGHHGSANSTTEELLEVIQHETAIVSVGADNFCGHPGKKCWTVWQL